MKILSDNKNKIAIYAFIIAVIAICVWAVTTKPATQKKAADDTPKQQTMDYTGNTIVEERDGKKIWEISADSIVMDPQTQKAEMQNITGKYYDENGYTLTLTAAHGIYDDKAKNITMDTGVHVERDDGLTFDSQSLSWDNDSQVFTGEGNVKIVKGDMQAEGNKIESSNAFSQFKLSGNAHIVKGSAAK
ncbi:LPS export ABC transporter periplasmic protein LptC [Pectinatus cerevisiiphilus]|uniref:LPS export ABC transporter protein LptC n=1 Tax=Pectinatus cerevisiiphilus TaxID=86956 RepID=A0A4R3KBN0_9FIRM|nr:LPS export ABC transporter periplasmic protein LptC [Pectinatus cerevisiiphilus]TCS80477.1 LPS export ABC transporter protein LptC [Pectinatus cerevisiiphilus]